MRSSGTNVGVPGPVWKGAVVALVVKSVHKG